MAKMQAPQDFSAVSVSGVQFDVVDGFVNVPDNTVEELSRLGFVQVPSDAPAPVVKPITKTPPAPPADSVEPPAPPALEPAADETQPAPEGSV